MEINKLGLGVPTFTTTVREVPATMVSMRMIEGHKQAREKKRTKMKIARESFQL